ncbi:MAG: helix-turn-helix domain-containing protein [Eubacteriales bacterium]|nr:helix-turn-helix domain-containing protein [Eubacteriales bacterium]
MPIRYKIDIMAALKEKGYSSYKLRKEKLLGESTMTEIRKGQIVSLENLTRLCRLLDCQPGDILEYVKND